jgi:DNA-binding transcriptional MerR regulator
VFREHNPAIFPDCCERKRTSDSEEDSALDKAPDAFRTISEVADDLDIPQHVLRFWETRFTQIKPMKRSGGRRYYRPEDVNLLRGIRRLLYGEGYTIRGVQRILREQGIKSVQRLTDRFAAAAPALAEPQAVAPELEDEEIEKIDAELEASEAADDKADEHVADGDSEDDDGDDDGEDDEDDDEETEEDDEDVEQETPVAAQRSTPARSSAIDFAVDPRPELVVPRRSNFILAEKPSLSKPSLSKPSLSKQGLSKTGLSKAHITTLKAALDDLMACQRLVDDALKNSPPEIFPLK